MLHMATSILSVPVLSFHSILQCSFLLPVKLTLSTLAYCISSTRDRCLILFLFTASAHGWSSTSPKALANRASGLFNGFYGLWID